MGQTADAAYVERTVKSIDDYIRVRFLSELPLLRDGFLPSENDVDALTLVLGRPPRPYGAFVQETATEWQNAQHESSGAAAHETRWPLQGDGCELRGLAIARTCVVAGWPRT